jgi:EmrB/QacA subfamily drug resistance transporter
MSSPDRPNTPLAPTTHAPRIGLASVAASLASGVVTLNLIIVNVAFSAMSRDLGASLTTIQWVSTAYVLGLMTTVPLTAWASATFGLKRLLLAALFVFMVASALCGAAWSVDSLICFRVLAGLAGGIVPPLVHAIVVRASGGMRLATAMSVLNGPVLAVPVFGPTLGGVLVVGLGWRWVFFISVPLTAVALALGARVLPDDEPEEAGRLDVGGLVFLSLSLVLLVYGLSQFGHGSSGVRGAVGVGCGLVLASLFALNARRLGPRGLLDLTLFGRRSFLAPAIIAALFSFMLFGSAAILPLYFESARGESPVVAGLLVALQGLGSAVGMFACGPLTDRYGARIVAAIASGFILLGTLPWLWLAPHTGYAILLLGLVVRGAGLSALMNAAYAVAYGTLEHTAVPGATAALNIVSRVSSAAGVAVAVVVVQSRAPDLIRLGAGVNGTALSQAVSAAFSETFLIFAALAIAVTLPALMLPRGRGPAHVSPELI